MRNIICFLIASIIMASENTAIANTRTISVNLEIKSTAINRFIAEQTFPTLSGTYQSIDYNVSITRPVVELMPNSAKVRFTIIANTSVGNYQFPVNPTISIPPNVLSLSQVIAFLENFPTLINNSSDIPSWLKPIIIDGYNTLQLVVYPSRLIDYANQAVPEFVDINVNDITFSLAVLSGKLQFTLSAIVQGNPPSFTAQWMKRGPSLLSIRFGANVGSTVKQVRLYSVNGEGYNQQTQLAIPKDGYCTQIDLSNITVATYYVTVLYASNFGQYARNYVFIFDTATYNQWFNMQLFQSFD